VGVVQGLEGEWWRHAGWGIRLYNMEGTRRVEENEMGDCMSEWKASMEA
jgi:hypothetical protein